MKILKHATWCVLVLAVGVSLTACVPRASAPGGGKPRAVVHSEAQATADLLAVPGVLRGHVVTGTAGLQLELQVRLVVSDDFEPAKLTPLVDYALAQAWAADEHKTDAATTMTVGREGESFPLVPSADALGFAGQAEPLLRIVNDEMTKRYGDWPGQVPALPAELAG